MVYLTRVEHFNAAHKLYNSNWSEEKNKEIFGKCANPHFHGHNFEIFVTVKGEPNPDTGFVMNAHELSAIIKKEIIDKFDHKNLNLDLIEFKDVLPSSENFIILIWKILEKHIHGCTLHSIKLMETPRIYVEYYGE
ncbi:MAG: 6-carboxytetrahydropterin synthase [Chitinophagales bacterium]|nr:6-carboxytetrahydropterin synthase [Chitinophagales bacterium]